MLSAARAVFLGLVVCATSASYAQAPPRTLASQGARAVSATIELPAPISGRALVAVDAADLLSRLELLYDNLELIRRYMGKPVAPAPLFRASDVTPPEIYFNSLNLQRRAHHFSFEQLRTTPPWDQPSTPSATETFKTLDRVLVTVLRVKQALGITEVVVERPSPSTATVSDVFNRMFATGALLNSLLDDRTNATDIYNVVSYAIQVAMRLHGEYSSALMPDEPEFVANRTSADVLREFEAIFPIVRRLGNNMGLSILELERAGAPRSVTPDDVSEFAIMIIGALNRVRMAAKLPDEPIPFGNYGRKFPSHVYQRTRLLRQVVEETVAGQAAKAASDTP